jgi:hypothetical protein
VGLLLFSAPPIYAQESPAFEKIRDLSPDGKFGLRISCSSKPDDPDNIDSSLVTAVDLVSLPSKKVVVSIGEEGTVPRFVWSPDSKWFAFPFSGGHRITYTHVYYLSGDDFVSMVRENEELMVPTKADVRNEYVTPVRWLKPGVLLLEQQDILRGGEGKDVYYRFTVKFGDQPGKFQVISKKKIPSKE